MKIKNDIVIAEFRSTGTTKHHVQTRAKFIKIVDKIRLKKNGWQLLLNGEISNEQNCFGSSVCYGVNEPSFFN